MMVMVMEMMVMVMEMMVMLMTTVMMVLVMEMMVMVLMVMVMVLMRMEMMVMVMTMAMAMMGCPIWGVLGCGGPSLGTVSTRETQGKCSPAIPKAEILDAASPKSCPLSRPWLCFCFLLEVISSDARDSLMRRSRRGLSALHLTTLSH